MNKYKIILSPIALLVCIIAIPLFLLDAAIEVSLQWREILQDLWDSDSEVKK